jgi:hypothetical protein
MKTKRVDTPARVVEIEALTENEMILLGGWSVKCPVMRSLFLDPTELLREHRPAVGGPQEGLLPQRFSVHS